MRIIYLIVILSLSSCSVMVHGTHQTVNVSAPNGVTIKSKTDIEKNDTIVSYYKRKSTYRDLTKGSGSIEARRNKSHYLIYSKPGHKDYVDLIMPKSITGAVVVGNIFPFFVFGWFIDSKAEAYMKFEKSYTLNQELKKIPTYTSDKKFIYVDSAIINIESTKPYVTNYKYRNYPSKKGKILYYMSSNNSNFRTHNYYLQNTLNYMLYDYGFIDSSNIVIDHNTVYINCELTSMNFSIVKFGESFLEVPFGFVNVEIDINWTLKDAYKSKLHEKTISSISGKVAYQDIFGKEGDFHLGKIIDDAVEYSFMDFLELEETALLLIKDTININPELPIVIKSNLHGSSIEDQKNQSVAIKTKNGHGSGCIISSDGYILTNYHVVKNENPVKVIFNNGDSITATVERYNKNSDVALLKIEKDSLISFKIAGEGPFIAEDVMLIGTPLSLDNINSISKGIISGIRNWNNIKYLQTDAKVNPGNSGGPMINSEGELIGIVNAKIVGIDVEGIGFAIPIEEVIKSLNLDL